MIKNKLKSIIRIFSVALVAILMLIGSMPAFAHCDSYDGPTVKDALKALETNDVSLVLKWIDQDQEAELIPLFHKTQGLKASDPEIYTIVEKHFLETLVRLHRETEGAPFTGLKPAGSTAPIIAMADHALEVKHIDGLLTNLNIHINEVVREKFAKVAELDKVKNESAESGRAYVAAYVDYTHTLEGIEAAMLGAHGHGH